MKKCIITLIMLFLALATQHTEGEGWKIQTTIMTQIVVNQNK